MEEKTALYFLRAYTIVWAFIALALPTAYFSPHIGGITDMTLRIGIILTSAAILWCAIALWQLRTWSSYAIAIIGTLLLFILLKALLLILPNPYAMTIGIVAILLFFGNIYALFNSTARNVLNRPKETKVK
jgi:hypothetical protein